MNIPEIFKYTSLASGPLFGSIALLLIKRTKDYSFNKHTLSESITFITKPTHNLLFRTNFVVKALLDLGFYVYVFNFLKIPFSSFIALSLIASAVLFGSLGYFIVGKYTTVHTIIVYTSGVLWAIGQILIARMIGNSFFSLFTIIAISIPIIVGFGSLFLKKTTIFVQISCVAIWYLWLLLFVFRYL